MLFLYPIRLPICFWNTYIVHYNKLFTRVVNIIIITMIIIIMMSSKNLIMLFYIFMGKLNKFKKKSLRA